VTTKKQYLEAEKKYREEMAPALESMLEDTIRESVAPNAIAMVGVVLGGFLLNLAIMAVVIGR
jgi:RNA processing factor Prp31